MKRCFGLVFAVCVLFALSARPAGAQTAGAQAAATDLQSIFSGKKVPLSLKLSDLNDGQWRKFGTDTKNGTGGMDYLRLITGGLSSLQGADALYTKGETMTVNGETFLVAYRRRPLTLDLTVLRGMTSPGELPKLAPPTADMLVELCLLNVRQMDSLTNIRPFDLAREISGDDDKPVVPPAQKEAAQNAQSLSNLKQIGLALLMYTQDYDEILPPLKNPAKTQEVLYPYLKNRELFQQPGMSGVTYAQNPILSGKKLAHITNPAEFAVFFEVRPAADGTRGVVFLDGHAKRVSESDEWPTIQRVSKLPMGIPPAPPGAAPPPP